jgi:hypothetical protein
VVGTAGVKPVVPALKVLTVALAAMVRLPSAGVIVIPLPALMSAET